jgi:LGFP repeat
VFHLHSDAAKNAHKTEEPVLTVTKRKGEMFSLRVICIAVSAAASLAVNSESVGASPNRGLLANELFRGQPVKAIYFFPGEYRAQSEPDHVYTAHPTFEPDKHWLSQCAGFHCNPQDARAGVMDRMVAAHANVVVVSYWEKMTYWSPMEPGLTPIRDVAEAAAGKRILLLPAIESGSDKAHPELSSFEFHQDFPYNPSLHGVLAPGLLARIHEIIGQFKGHMEQWAQLYDRDGWPRYAIQIIHTYSDVETVMPGKTSHQVFAEAFQRVADDIAATDHIQIGFTLDVIPGERGTYTPAPGNAGPVLEGIPAVLAIQGFASEVFSGKVNISKPFEPAIDNNKTNLYAIVDWKAQALHDWVVTGVPVIYDVSSGFDGRFVWNKVGTAFWGDNLNYTDDRWRNALSQFKGNGIKGITFNTWNGYTEGYAATPTREHSSTIYNWLSDLYEPDPRVCSHMQYDDGHWTFRVYGAVCERWAGLGGDRGLVGEPMSEEMDGAHGRVQHFRSGNIYWSGVTGAHEVHGLILKAYRNVHAEGGCLGLPVTDELPEGANGQIQKFQNGVIHWKQGDPEGSHTCGVH